MRTRDKFLLASALLMGFVCSCSEDPMEYADQSVPAVFVPSVDDMDVSTRVVNNTWSGNESVGIHMVAAGAALPASAAFNTYKPAAAGTSVALNPTAAAQTIYYPVNGSNVNFFAFSPYKAPTSNQVTYSATDQSTKAKQEAVDFIWVKATGTYNKTKPNVSMAFAHKQSKIIVKVTAGTGVPAADIAPTTATLTIGAMPCGATYKLADGALAGSITTGTLTPFKSATTTTSVTWEGIVPPHAGTAYTTRKMNFNFNGKTYSYTMPTADAYVAGKSYTYNLTLTTSGVVLQSTTVSNWTGGSTSWNGGKYVLHTTSSDLRFSPTASSQTLTIQYQGTTTAPVAKVSTSATSVTGTVSWLTATVATGTTTSSPWTQRVLTVNTTSANTGTTNRIGYIHVSLEGLSVVIEVTQAGVVNQGDANCYIVAPGGTITFSLARAVTYGKAAATATFTAVKVWDDAAGGAVKTVGTPSGTGENATLTITAGTNPGNAVVAVQVNGATYWSWHIWVTHYNPNVSSYINTYNTNKNGKHFEFMDRNLGALYAGTGFGYGTGLFYQWGRKDPFPATLAPGATQPGGGKFTVTTTSSAVTAVYAARNPGVFFTATDATDRDWHYASRNNTLWGHGNTTAKSRYDPCPAGWRVPSHNFPASTTDANSRSASPWWGLQLNAENVFSGGYSFGLNAAYPVLGYRSYSSGQIGPTTLGQFWSASPYNTQALRFLLATTLIDESSHVERAYGASIRCVRE